MSATIAIIAPVILLIVVILASLFLSNRLAIYFNYLSIKKWRIILLVAVIGSIASMLVFTTTAHWAGRYVFMLSSVIIGFMLYLLLSTLFFELTGLILPIKTRIRAYLSLSVAAMICIYGSWNAARPMVKEVTIPVAGLQKEIRAIHLTDIHLGNFRGKRFLDKVVKKVSELQPNVIFHTGDLFDAKVPLHHNTLAAFGTLNIPHFFVEGNHDIEAGRQEVFDLLDSQGINILENEIVQYNNLQIIGLKYMLADSMSFDIHTSEEKETIAEVLERLPIEADSPTIVLHHSPMGLQYAQEHGVELMLSGHTHGGQMWPLTYIAQWLFVYNNGLYQFEDLTVYTSQGIGTMFSLMRIGTRSEITLLKLIPVNNRQNKLNI